MKLKETELKNKKITKRIMNGDPSISWQVIRDLLRKSKNILKWNRSVKLADGINCRH